MRYKDQINKRIDRLDSIRKKLEFQINRKESWEEIEYTLSEFEATTEKIREYISIEHED